MNGKWSDELTAYTLEHLGDAGAVYMKNLDGRFALCLPNAYLDGMMEKLHYPKEAMDRAFVLIEHCGIEYMGSYDTVEDMVADGWVMD